MSKIGGPQEDKNKVFHDSLWLMKTGEQITSLSGFWQIERVPNGWIYMGPETSVFVPEEGE